ncbi:MAG: polysaccharide biosynthesis tyrosine autokinase [Deltaproteobacteria bacterium]|nr:polysaccharide biosynthesis tyrosine autokinase [Deltaproteobacteria bacterium]
MLHLRDYWRTVRKRIWTLITAFALIVGSVTVITLLTPPVYQASASLQIDAQPRAPTGGISAIGEYGSGQYLTDQEYYNTQHKKLWSRSHAQAVFDRLGLAEHELYRDLEEPVDALKKQVNIEPIPKTRLVWVYVRAPSPDLAEQVNAAWTETFVESNYREINQGIQDGLAWLRSETTKAQDDVRRAEESIQGFRQKNNQIALSTDEKGHVATQQIEQLSMDKGRAEAELARRQAEYEGLASAVSRQDNPTRLSLLVASELMSQLRENYATLVTELAALEQKYGEKMPQVVEARLRVDDIARQIRGEAAAELGRRAAMREEAGRAVVELGNTIDALTSSALSASGPQAEYNLLKRDLEAKRRIYDELLARQQEMAVTASLKENNIRIIDTALAEVEPVEPNYVRNIALALAAGLLAGVSLALFFDYMDTTIKTREEVEALGIPFLGIIPSVPGLAGEGWEIARERYLYSYKYPKSAFAEFIRNIRTSVNFSAREDGQPPRRLLITSAGPREGKTTSSINLGISFAATGRRVCLVDADLRRPSLHHAFGLDNERGLSTLMSGADAVAGVVQPTPQEGLFILPSGPRPPNPAEQLGSQGCRDALDKLNEQFDLVIIDTPPVVAVTDAVVLANDVDGVIMVIKSFKVARDLVLQAKRQLNDVEARLIGVILNDFDIQRKSYGYYYYYTYYGAERDDVAKVRRSMDA